MRFLEMKLDIAPLLAQVEDIKAATEAAVRPAAQAGAEVYYRQVKANVAALGRVTGNLDSAIYQAFSPDNSNATSATYHISWNHRKAPHGHLVEYGHYMYYQVSYDSKTKRFVTHKDQPLNPPRYVPGKAFVRSAASRVQDVLSAMEQRFFQELEQRGVIA